MLLSHYDSLAVLRAKVYALQRLDSRQPPARLALEFANGKAFGRGDSPRHLRCVFAAASRDRTSDWIKLEGGRQPPCKPARCHHETCVRAVVARSVAADVINHVLLAV
jgi:hypothetical protein